MKFLHFSSIYQLQQSKQGNSIYHFAVTLSATDQMGMCKYKLNSLLQNSHFLIFLEHFNNLTYVVPQLRSEDFFEIFFVYCLGL